MNKMLTHLNGYKREAVLAPLFKMLEATFDLFVPLVMADIVNVGIAAHDLHYILVRCGILLLLAVIGLTCSLTAQYFSAKAAVGYSTSLRHALFEHIQKPEFLVRWRWSPNAVAFWDNRVTQHYAVNDYLPHRRIMNRATVLGDRPYHRSRPPADLKVAAQ